MRFSLHKLFRFLLIACAVVFLVIFYQKNPGYVGHVDEKLQASNIPVINTLENVVFMDYKISSRQEDASTQVTNESLLQEDDGQKGNRTESLSLNATTEVSK